MKILAGVLPVIALCVIGGLTDYQEVSLWVIFATLPVTALFIGAYSPEYPWRGWFGTSLLLLAFSVLAVCLAGLLFRIYGLNYPFRELLGMTWVGLMFVSMVIRTWVLIDSQWRDGLGLGGLLRRIARR